MSPLWPETISIGLFPGQCWMRRGRDAQSFALGQSGQPADLLQALAGMLAQPGKPWRKGSRVQLMVSDGLAAIAVLPWQEQLTAAGEMQQYAQACFEREGYAIDGAWAMRGEFRHFRAMGLAYALPRAWLEDVLALLGSNGLRLKRILPVSACAYWHQPRPSSVGQALVLLRETRRASALIYDRRGLLGFDVEPVTLSAPAATSRLLLRISARYLGIHSVRHWNAELPNESAPDKVIPACLPNAAVHAVGRGAWGG